MSRNLCLVGMMGAGKSTVATLLGERLGRLTADTDDEIRGWTGRSIPELFAAHGERGFRALERQVVEEVAKLHDLVLSLGGGAVLRDDNVASLLLTGVIVYLDAPPRVLAERLREEVADRPLLAGAAGPDGSLEDLEAKLRQTYEDRAERYAAVADVTVDASRSPEMVVEEILSWAMDAGDVLTPSEHEQVMR